MTTAREIIDEAVEQVTARLADEPYGGRNVRAVTALGWLREIDTDDVEVDAPDVNGAVNGAAVDDVPQPAGLSTDAISLANALADELDEKPNVLITRRWAARFIRDKIKSYG